MPETKGASPDIPLTPEAAADVRALAAGGGLQILGQVIQRVLALAYTAIAVRVLGTSGYGVYRQVAQVLNVGGIFGVAGFEYAVVREVSAARAVGDPGRVRGSVRAAVRGALIASLLVTAALVLVAPRLGASFAESASDADTFTFLFRVGAPFVALFSLAQVLRFSTHPYRTMIPSVVSGHVVRPVARFVFGVAALAAGFAVTGAVVSLVLSAAAGLVAAAWYARRLPTPAERTAAPTSRTGPLVRFAILQGAAAMLSIQTLGLGIIILGLYRSDAAVGIYAIALSLLTPVNILFTGLSPIWAPMVTELYERGEVARLGSLFQTVNRWLSTFGFPVLAALALQPDVFIRILAGESGVAAESALVVLAAGHFFYIGTGPTSFVLSMSGHPGINLGYSFMQVSLFIVLGVLSVPTHGLMGMAWVSAIVTVVGNVARVIHVRILIGIQPFGSTFFKPVIATIAAAVPMAAANLIDGWVLGAASVAAGALFFLVALRLLGMDPQEAHVFDQLKRRARALRKTSR